MSELYKDVVYPGQYEPWELKTMEQIRKWMPDDPDKMLEYHKKNKAGMKLYRDLELNSGLLPADYTIGTYDLQVTSNKLNPHNPLYTDASYARASKYGSAIACPLAVNIGVGFPYIPKYSDGWSTDLREADLAPIGGLDHELTFHKPVLAGDTLQSVIRSQRFEDVTNEEGSPYRKLRVIGEGDMYNQNGEKVMSIYHSAVEKRRVFREADLASEFMDVKVNHASMGASGKLAGMQLKPPFVTSPIHEYTDQDWDYIKDLWSKEYVRGKDTLYWEDVQIGDEPAWTCDGPLFGDNTRGPNVMFMPGKTVRDVMTAKPSDKPEDPMMMMMGGSGKLVKGEHGVYNLEKGQMGPPPGAGGQTRGKFMNTVGRDLGCRMITNWIGDEGWLYKLCWRLSCGGQMFPETYDRPSYLFKVPYLKEAGRCMEIHGMEYDLCITKGYVCDKYVADDGRHLVDMVAWCETIDGAIWSELYAVIELPSKEG